MKRTLLSRAVAAGSALALTLAASFPASAASRVQFNCNAGVATCYFSVFTGSSMSNFTLPGGQSHVFGGLQYGDTYCVSSTGPNNPNTCPRRLIPRESFF